MNCPNCKNNNAMLCEIDIDEYPEEGETEVYHCADCGYTFQIDWDYESDTDEPF